MGASTSKEFEEAFGGLCVGSGRKQDVSKPHSDGDVKEATRARDLLDDSISFEEDVPKGEETLIIEAQSEEMAKLDKMLYHGWVISSIARFLSNRADITDTNLPSIVR